MSGPKTSRYKLTPAQRRMLIAQRERQRRCGEASAFLASIRTKLCRLKQFPADELERAEILMQRTGEHVYSEKRDELCQRVQEAIEKIDEVKGSNDPALLERTLEQASRSTKGCSTCAGNWTEYPARSPRSSAGTLTAESTRRSARTYPGLAPRRSAAQRNSGRRYLPGWSGFPRRSFPSR